MTSSYKNIPKQLPTDSIALKICAVLQQPARIYTFLALIISDYESVLSKLDLIMLCKDMYGEHAGSCRVGRYSITFCLLCSRFSGRNIHVRFTGRHYLIFRSTSPSFVTTLI